MDRQDRHSADFIDAASRPLTEWTLEGMASRDETFRARHDSEALQLWRGELRHRIRHLAESVSCRTSELLARNVVWSREAFEARGIPCTDLEASLAVLGEVIDEHMPASVAERCAEPLAAAMARLHEAAPCRSDRAATEPTEPLAGEDDDAAAARLYLLHLLDRSEEEATRVLLDLQEAGRGTTEIYERVISPALAEIGRMWHLGEATVADEHFATGTTRLIMAELRRHAPRAAPCGRSVLCTAVGGDLHDLGIRMVADVFEFAGWESQCLGADMPSEAVVEALQHRVTGRFDLLAIAANTTLGLRPAADLIEEVRASGPGKGVRIIVGGLPFRIAPDLARLVGADGCANRASEAVALAERLLRPSSTPAD